MTRPRLLLAAIFVGLVVLTLAAYAPALTAGYVWDDDAWLTGNTAIADPNGLRTIWTSVTRMQYYPLLFTSWWLEYRLWGLEPFGYHLVNVLLHAGNAFLVGLVLRSLGIRGAFWAAALFAVHPVHVESVAWVTERKNVLSGLFFLGAALAYLEFDVRRKRGVYALALALFACALLTKTATASLPVALAIVLTWKKWPRRPREWAPLAPFVLLALALASITVVLEKGMVDVVGTDFGFAWRERVVIAARALLFYPFKLLVPYPTIFNYPRWEVVGFSWDAAWPLLATAAAASGLVVAWRRGNRGLTCAALVYAVTIFPAIGFFDVYAFRFSFVADHFQYLASIPLLALLPQAERWLGSAARPIGIAVALLLAALTWKQAGAYRDEATLWKDTIAKNPDSWIAYNNLAILHSDSGDLDAAIAGFDEAIRCKPASAESYTGRGLAHARKGRADLALADLDRAIELDPTFPAAYLNRSDVLMSAGRVEEAVADLDRFIASNPGHAPAFLNRGMARAQLGQDSAALDDFSRAIQLQPSAALHARRGFVLSRLHRFEAALSDLDAAARLDPNLTVAYLLRGGIYQALDGNTARACTQWQQACRLGDCGLFNARCR